MVVLPLVDVERRLAALVSNADLVTDVDDQRYASHEVVHHGTELGDIGWVLYVFLPKLIEVDESVSHYLQVFRARHADEEALDLEFEVLDPL